MSLPEPPYLSLDRDIEQAIQEDRASGWKNPRAFDDARVLRREDNPHDMATVTRPAFARDIEKIINTPAYNRYADKTQVFSFVENDDICRRGLHVQLVSRIARGISDLLGRTIPQPMLRAPYGALFPPQRTFRPRHGQAVPT